MYNYFIFLVTVLTISLKSKSQAYVIHPKPVAYNWQITGPGGDIRDNIIPLSIDFQQHYFLYEIESDVDVKKITLSSRLNPKCARFNMSFYDYKGHILFEQYGTIETVFNGNPTSFPYFPIIELDTTLTLKKGFYYIGFSGNHQSDGNFPSNCFPTFGGDWLLGKPFSYPFNQNASMRKIFFRINSSLKKFPTLIPVEDTTIEHRTFYNDGLKDKWYTETLARFPILRFN